MWRALEHNLGRHHLSDGARYTRLRPPVKFHEALKRLFWPPVNAKLTGVA